MSDLVSSGAFLYWTDKKGDSKVLWFDVVTEESHQLQSEIVEEPVEEGVNITDHIRPKVPLVTLQTFVSNTPIYDRSEVLGKIYKGLGSPAQPPTKIIGAQKGNVKGLDINPGFYEPPLVPTPGGLLNAAIGGIVNALTGQRQYRANVLQFDEQFDTVRDVYEALEQARQEAQLFNVVTSSRTYSNMALEDINQTKTPETGTGATFRLELRQVRLVSTKTVSIPKPADPSAEKIVNKGTKNTKAAQESVAIKFVDTLGNYAGVKITPDQGAGIQ